MGDRLTDAQLREAAAARPGYATYPEYRPGQPERLGQLPAVTAPPTLVLKTMLRLTDDDAHALKEAFLAAARRREAPQVLPPGPVLDARPPAPAAAPVAATLVALPESPVFDFQPCLITERPWWRRRWHWGVMAAGARTHHGYAWTEAGARRRTARAARRAVARA